jgi:hypothetical protein
MASFFAEYQAYSLHKHMALLSIATVVALGINIVLIQGLDSRLFGGSVRDASVSFVRLESADITLRNLSQADTVVAQVGSLLTGAREIRMSVLTNASSLTFGPVMLEPAIKNMGAELIVLPNTPGSLLINIRFSSPQNIPAKTDLINIITKKPLQANATSQEGNTAINLIETIAITTAGKKTLSAQGIDGGR